MQVYFGKTTITIPKTYVHATHPYSQKDDPTYIADTTNFLLGGQAAVLKAARIDGHLLTADNFELTEGSDGRQDTVSLTVDTNCQTESYVVSHLLNILSDFRIAPTEIQVQSSFDRIKQESQQALSAN